MDNMAYLQQISSTSKPVAQKKGFSFNPKILIFIGIGIALVIFMAVISSALSNVTDKEKDEAMRLHVRTNYLLGALEGYTNLVKSSELRSMGNTLSTHLTELNRDLAPLLTEYWELKNWEKDISPEILAEEEEHASEFFNKLEDARLNGLLDRVYVREFALQLALLNSIQTEVIARTEKEDLLKVLERSVDNLKELRKQFSDYTDLSN